MKLMEALALAQAANIVTPDNIGWHIDGSVAEKGKGWIVSSGSYMGQKTLQGFPTQKEAMNAIPQEVREMDDWGTIDGLFAHVKRLERLSAGCLDDEADAEERDRYALKAGRIFLRW